MFFSLFLEWQTNLIEYLHCGYHILVHVLTNDKYARFVIPTKEEIESLYLQSIHDTLHSEIEELGIQWMDLSFILKKHQTFMSTENFTMVGLMTIMSQMCLYLLQMELFPYHFSMSLNVFMTT